MIFEIRDTIFPNNLKPLPNFDITITVLTLVFTIVRILSIITAFIFLYFRSAYNSLLKSEVLNFASTTLDSSPIINKRNHSKNPSIIVIEENIKPEDLKAKV